MFLFCRFFGNCFFFALTCVPLSFDTCRLSSMSHLFPNTIFSTSADACYRTTTRTTTSQSTAWNLWCSFKLTTTTTTTTTTTSQSTAPNLWCSFKLSDVRFNRRFPSCLSPLFQSESKCKAFHMEISFIHTQILVHLHVNKTNFHMKDFVLGLALKQKQNATRKSPIQL